MQRIHTLGIVMVIVALAASGCAATRMATVGEDEIVAAVAETTGGAYDGRSPALRAVFDAVRSNDPELLERSGFQETAAHVRDCRGDTLIRSKVWPAPIGFRVLLTAVCRGVDADGGTYHAAHVEYGYARSRAFTSDDPDAGRTTEDLAQRYAGQFEVVTYPHPDDPERTISVPVELRVAVDRAFSTYEFARGGGVHIHQYTDGGNVYLQTDTPTNPHVRNARTIRALPELAAAADEHGDGNGVATPWEVEWFVRDIPWHVGVIYGEPTISPDAYRKLLESGVRVDGAERWVAWCHRIEDAVLATTPWAERMAPIATQ